jgi:hypothetical protein
MAAAAEQADKVADAVGATVPGTRTVAPGDAAADVLAGDDQQRRVAPKELEREV